MLWLKLAALLAATIVTMLFVWLGFSYHYEGYGLHPVLAAFGAFIFYAFPLGLLLYDVDWLERELDTAEYHVWHLQNERDNHWEAKDAESQ